MRTRSGHHRKGTSHRPRTRFQKWGEALRMYNRGKKFTIPKKGTPAYAAVKKIMDRL